MYFFPSLDQGYESEGSRTQSDGASGDENVGSLCYRNTSGTDDKAYTLNSFACACLARQTVHCGLEIQSTAKRQCSLLLLGAAFLFSTSRRAFSHFCHVLIYFCACAVSQLGFSARYNSDTRSNIAIIALSLLSLRPNINHSRLTCNSSLCTCSSQ